MTARQLSLCLLLSIATSVEGQFTFAPSIQYGAITNPSGMTSLDFDRDGDLDLATTADGPDRVVIFRNAGDGTFGTSVNVLLPNTSSPQDVIAGDFDGDLDQDLAVALRDPVGTVQLMLNNGAGLFAMGGSAAVGSLPRGFSVADIDGDMDLDLTVANRDSDSMSILTNNGLGILTASTVAVGGDPRDTAVGNFLSDAGLEIAVTNNNDRTVTILDELAGVYSIAMTLNIGAPRRPDGITAADFNGDGLDDLAVAAGDPDVASIFLNNGAGFNGPFNYATGGLNSSGIRTGDFNCDGHLDLVVSNTDSGNISLLANNGDGTFTAAQLLMTGSEPSELTLGDWDNDGDLDVGVVNSLSNNISVLINNTCTIVTPDFNGDGILDCADVDGLVAEIVSGTNLASFDLTGDGSVNAADLTRWLADAGATNLPSGNSYLVGDANLDGTVDGLDFIEWNANKFTLTAAWCSGDFNANGTVDGEDFILWNQNKFSSADSSATQAVPEPTGLILALQIALCGLATRRRASP